ncbi:MAG: RNA 2'-phosphotransferase [Bacteroidales bacterium]|nr:RNA 2'-phosphotransferase [Bacteroidales bacterium]
MTELIHKEKRLAYLLRHDIQYAFDAYGWREVSDLVANHGFSQEELTSIVANSNKQRFEFSEDGLFLRARQGHSIPVDVELAEAKPTEYLYHGTVATNLPSIMEKGLVPMSRQHVHLSVDESTAMKVGSRRKGAVVVLRVAAHKMWEDGHHFWQARNGIWLTETVPPKYLETITQF